MYYCQEEYPSNIIIKYQNFTPSFNVSEYYHIDVIAIKSPFTLHFAGASPPAPRTMSNKFKSLWGLS